MPRRVAAGLAAVCFLALVAPLAARADESAPLLRVGYGVADATWQIGAGGGQHADKAPPTADGSDIDPQQHSLTQQDTYGVASRLSMRAIVVEGANGKRIAIVKSDNYLAQNYLVRRVGQLLADAGSTITPDDILHSASHNHSSPYYSTPSWGVWAFQDAMDLRAFEYQARAMTRAILDAEAALVPARMGATVVHHEIFKNNYAGRELSHDGTPAGYPDEFGDLGLTVMRFEALDGTPIAAWVNWGQHPESLDGYDLITADYLGPLQRMVERETGAPLVFSQGDVGSSEGPYYPRANNPVLPDGVIKAWAHVGHAQMERGARYLADSIAEGWKRIGDGTSEVPLVGGLPVDTLTYWAPGPVSHPYPSVGNCRSNQTFEGDPGAPGAGLPDCQRTEGATPVHNDLLWESLRSHGLPVPANYDLPSHGAVEENYRLELQVVRIGDVILGSCSCEAQVDLILNFESRANDVAGDIWDGYPWDEQCTDNGDGRWTCPDTNGGTSSVTDAAFQHMKAQIHNDAAGWDAPDHAPYANSDPADPGAIKGNFTKEELDPTLGYKIAVGLGHTGDYNGYTVSYREYMARDAYRKALTSYGPHTADYMVTRLVRMAGALKSGDPFVPDDPMSPLATADEARQESVAQALGHAAGAAYDAWHTVLADDAGPAAIVHEPTSITRFDAATVGWIGGSNAVDNPTVRVERRDGNGGWQPFADQSGEIQTKLDMPDGAQGVADAWTGRQSWHWTASFEAYDAFPARLGQVPNGTYRFVVDGVIRQAGDDTPYHLESSAFDVTPWEGITVSDLRVDPEPPHGNGRGDGPRKSDVSFVIDPILYPRTYTSPFRYVRDDGDQRLCITCAFRPWAKEGTPKSATLTVTNASGKVVRSVEAASVNGRWVANTDLHDNEVAWLQRDAVRDVWGEGNLARYGIAADGTIVPTAVAADTITPSVESTGDSLPISSSRAPYLIPVGAPAALALIALIVRRSRRCAVS